MECLSVMIWDLKKKILTKIFLLIISAHLFGVANHGSTKVPTKYFHLRTHREMEIHEKSSPQATNFSFKCYWVIVNDSKYIFRQTFNTSFKCAKYNNPLITNTWNSIRIWTNTQQCFIFYNNFDSISHTKSLDIIR